MSNIVNRKGRELLLLAPARDFEIPSAPVPSLTLGLTFFVICLKSFIEGCQSQNLKSRLRLLIKTQTLGTTGDHSPQRKLIAQREVSTKKHLALKSG